MSSSDSEAENNNKVVKRRRVCRKVASKPAVSVKPFDSDLASIYSSSVRNYCKKKDGIGQLETENTPSAAKNGEEIDNAIWDSNKKSRKKKVLADVPLKPVQKSLSVSLSSSDDDYDEDIEKASVIRANRSPSPPPTDVRQQRRKRRMNRSTKKLLSRVDTAVATARIANFFTQLQNDTSLNDSCNVICVEEDENIDVKVRVSGVVKRYKMTKNESFSKVIHRIAADKNVDETRVLLSLNDTNISSHETPSSQNITIADIIECYIVTSSTAMEEAELIIPPQDLVKLKVQSIGIRSTTEISIGKFEPLSKLMMKYSHFCGVPPDKIRFEFDGDTVSKSDTPSSLDMDNGDCLDAVIRSDHSTKDPEVQVVSCSLV